jgi:hypothetical protein
MCLFCCVIVRPTPQAVQQFEGDCPLAELFAASKKKKCCKKFKKGKRCGSCPKR